MKNNQLLLRAQEPMAGYIYRVFYDAPSQFTNPMMLASWKISEKIINNRI